jgi:hypothetical protein
MDTLWELFKTIGIAAVSSWITVLLSLRRFRAERWWDRKVDAYTTLIEAFYSSKAFTTAHLEAQETGREVSEENDVKYRKLAEEAHQKIEKAIDTGSFILCDEALARLREYREEANQAGEAKDWYSFLDAHCAATDKCLKEIIPIAQNDLKINRKLSAAWLKKNLTRGRGKNC